MTPSPAISARSLAPDLSFNRRRDYVKLTEVAESLLPGALSMIAESTRLSLAFTAYKSARERAYTVSRNPGALNLSNKLEIGPSLRF